MELLILLLLPLAIASQRYHPSATSNANDQPFLPIYPVYPYSPKLIKRGTDRDLLSQLSPELYAPKLDARDSYTSSYNANYQRDPYYPSYNPYPKTSAAYLANPQPVPSSSNHNYPAATYNPPSSAYAAPAATTYSPYAAAGYTSPYPYTGTAFAAYSTPYNPSNPYSYSPSTYPNYNYQAPYFYPNYYNQPYPPLPPPPPPAVGSPPGQEYPESSAEDSSEDTTTSSRPKKPETKRNRIKDNEDDQKDGRFVDGANYLSSGSKDLDSQPSTYKTPSPYNQLEEVSDVHLRSVPGLPRTTYRVISVGGQPVAPDYPLPQTYAKVQQLEQLMSQTLAKLLAQNVGRQIGGFQNNQQVDNAYRGQPTVNKSPVIAKTGLGYVVPPANLPKNPPAPFNYPGPQDPSVSDPGTTVLEKAAAKYADGQYSQKPITTVTLQQAPGVYIPPEAKATKDLATPGQSAEYNDYDSQPAQNYENTSYKKTEQNYSLDQPYHSSNLVTVQTPQPQNFRYSSYLPTQSTQQQQQSRDYKTSLDDVNFSKRNSKI